MAFQTIGELRAALARENLGWSVNPRLHDSMRIKRPPLGLLPNTAPKANPSRRLDVAALVRSRPTPNRLLAKDLLARGVLLEHPLQFDAAIPAGPSAAAAGAPLTMVDWRNRFGWNWITGIRDQDPCEHCWIYGATALIEAMVRIEHCVWCSRSEGDYIEANKVPCGQCGSPGPVLDWAKSNGMADVDCVPWLDHTAGNKSGPYWNPPPDRCGGGSMAAPPAWQPASNRPGRTVRIPAYTSIDHVDDQKNWLRNVGPLVCFFEVFDDFQGWSGPNPYQKLSSAKALGGHIMLVVGFDDGKGCWIVKNSWGTGLGEHGYWLIKYGQCSIDDSAKLGLRLTNPDPWTKRRLHNGGMFESGNGAFHSNFELAAPGPGNSVAHWWRDNGTGSLPWAKAVTLGNDVGDPPTFTSTTFTRNMEMIYRTTAGRLHHRFFAQGGGGWKDGPVFGPTNAAGGVGFCESTWGPGNFEVVVAVGGRMRHWWRNGAFTWAESATFGQNIHTAGPSLLQSTWGNLELVAVLNGGQMEHWWRDGSTWKGDQKFGAGITTPPVMIQGQYGMADENGNGNFELVVANASGVMEHWWRNNTGSGFPWANSATFGSGIARVLALVEGSFGFDLEVVALRTDANLQHYWRDGGGWHAGVVIGSTH